MADEMVPTLMAHVHVLIPVLGMPLNFLKDVVIFGLCGISSPRFLLPLASFSFLLSPAALGHGHHHRSFSPSRGIG
jgi:hypothetical protein